MAKKKTIAELLRSKPIEITTGVTIEKSDAFYYNLEALKKQPEPLYRLDIPGYRYYYRIQNNEPIFYTSVTTLLKNTMPTSPHLIQWLISKGGDEGKAEAEERANYGTLYHAECGQLMINKTYDLDKLDKRVKEYCEIEKIEYKIEWVDEMRKDLLAFAQFLIDYKVQPLAVEIMLYHPYDGYAGALDLVCTLELEEKGFYGDTYLSGEKKGQPKESKKSFRRTAVIDLKSGRKSFYESYELQLACYKFMWDFHFPELPVERIMNFSPKEWRQTPSYNLKDQTDSKNLGKLKSLVELNRIEESKRENRLTIISGKIDLEKGLTDNVHEYTLTELIKQNV